MKKLVLFFAVAFAMSFAACSSKTTSDATSADSTMVDSISVVEETVIVDRKAELSKIILDNIRPSVMLNIIIRRLNDLEIGDFFGITTSLSEINLLKPTKEVEN